MAALLQITLSVNKPVEQRKNPVTDHVTAEQAKKSIYIYIVYVYIYL